MLTEKEIKLAAIEMMPNLIEEKGYNYSMCDNWDKGIFELAFEAGYKLALEQPIKIWVVLSIEGEEGIFKSEEKARTALKNLQKDHPSIMFSLESKELE